MSKLRSITISGKPLTYNEYVYDENKILISINKRITPELETLNDLIFICDKCNELNKNVTKICYKCYNLCCLSDHERFKEYVCIKCFK